MKSIPVEYFEAAQVDGAGALYMFLHIALPQMKSGIAALTMLVFIEYWNIVEQVIIFIKGILQRTPVGILITYPDREHQLDFCGINHLSASASLVFDAGTEGPGKGNRVIWDQVDYKMLYRGSSRL